MRKRPSTLPVYIATNYSLVNAGGSFVKCSKPHRVIFCEFECQARFIALKLMIENDFNLN